MRETTTLNARTREPGGSAAARRLRRAGEVPANLSGLGKEPLAIAVNNHEFGLLQAQGARLITLEVDGESVESLVRDVQHDAIGDEILHIDFDRVERGHTLEVEVPITFFGEPAGAAQGGIFQILLVEVRVECLPDSIPENIEVDVTALGIGDEVRIRDLQVPEGVKLVDVHEEDLVAHVSAPTVEEEEEESVLEAEAQAQPEVIAKKKAEEEEEGD